MLPLQGIYKAGVVLDHKSWGRSFGRSLSGTNLLRRLTIRPNLILSVLHSQLSNPFCLTISGDNMEGFFLFLFIIICPLQLQFAFGELAAHCNTCKKIKDPILIVKIKSI